MCIFMSMYFGNFTVKKLILPYILYLSAFFKKALGICFEKSTLDFIFGCNLNGGLSTKA